LSAEAFGIYGPAGSGKTRLAAACVRGWPEAWGGQALYVPIDPGSDSLGSILMVDRVNMYKYKEYGGAKGMDPYRELCKIIENKEVEKSGCQTLILDTMTTVSRQILQAVANSGKFSDKHIALETQGIGKINLAMPGDYKGAQQCIMNFLDLAKFSGVNILAVFHDGLFEPEATSSAPTVGGPATVGRSSLAPIAGWFHNLVRLEARSKGSGETRSVEYWASTEKKGPYLAKLRIPLPKNPIPDFRLDDDPVNFWIKLKEIHSG